MKKKFTSTTRINFIVFLLSLIFYAQPGMSQTEIIVPTDTLHWERVTCGDWENSGDSLKFYGTDFRSPGVIQSKDFYDFRGGQVFIKWKVNGAGNFMAATMQAAGYSLGSLSTTDHSWDNSIVLDENKWYFTQAKFNLDSTLTVIRSTGDFDENGGARLDSVTIPISEKKWNLQVKNGKVLAMLHDNYGGDQCYITLGYVKLKNIIKLNTSYVSSKTFDFEDGKMPKEITTDTNPNWMITDTGYQSHKSMYLISKPGESSYFEMNVNHAAKVGFDIRFISGYEWITTISSAFAIDTLGVVTFDRSNKGCWHHFEWFLPDTGPHNLRWYSSYSGSYPQGDSRFWVDNITVYHSEATGIGENNTSRNPFLKIFPNPFSRTTTIQFELSEPSVVSVRIYNIMGQLVQKWENRKTEAGINAINWDASELQPGNYFCKLTAGNKLIVKKIMLLR